MCLIFGKELNFKHFINGFVILLFLLCFQFGYNQNVSDIRQQKLNDTHYIDYSYVDTIYDEYSDGEAMDSNLAPVVVDKDFNSSKSW